MGAPLAGFLVALSARRREPIRQGGKSGGMGGEGGEREVRDGGGGAPQETAFLPSPTPTSIHRPPPT